MAITIYGLIDPRTNELRYVGKTRLSVQERLYRHANEAKKCWRLRWMRCLEREGLRPDTVTLEVVAEDKWVEAERFWIAYFRFIGSRLTNLTDGGEGRVNGRNSPEAIARMAASKRGKKTTCKNPAQKSRKISLAHKGKIITLEQREKLRAHFTGKRFATTQAQIPTIERMFQKRKTRGEIAKVTGLSRRTVGLVIMEKLPEFKGRFVPHETPSNVRSAAQKKVKRIQDHRCALRFLCMLNADQLAGIRRAMYKRPRKLNPNQEREMRDEYTNGRVTQRALATKYGVSLEVANRTLRQTGNEISVAKFTA